jgi:hypothetical protein
MALAGTAARSRAAAAIEILQAFTIWFPFPAAMAPARCRLPKA